MILLLYFDLFSGDTLRASIEPLKGSMNLSVGGEGEEGEEGGEGGDRSPYSTFFPILFLNLLTPDS